MAAGCAALLLQSGEATTPRDIRTRLKTSSYIVTVPESGLSFPRLDCSVGTPDGVPDEFDVPDEGKFQAHPVCIDPVPLVFFRWGFYQSLILI